MGAESGNLATIGWMCTEHSYQEGLRWAHCKDSRFLGGQSPGMSVKPDQERAGGGAEHQVHLQGRSTPGHKTCHRSPLYCPECFVPFRVSGGWLVKVVRARVR